MDLSYFDKLIEEADSFINGLDEDTIRLLNDNINRYKRFKKNFKLDKRSFYDYQSSLKYYDILAKKTKSERNNVFESIIRDAENELFYTKNNYWHERWREENRENLVEFLDFFENFYVQFSEGLKSFKGQLYENKNKIQKIKNTDLYLKKLLRRTLNETLDDKTHMLKNKIRKYEIDELGGDDEFTKGDPLDYNPKDWKEYDIEDIIKNLDSTYGGKRKRRYDDEDEDEDRDLMFEGETCEQCGSGEMREGECMECGSKSMYESSTYDLNGGNEFDYTEEEEETTPFELENLIEGCKSSMKLAKESKDKVSMNHAKNECGIAMDALEEKNDTKKIEELESFLNESKKLVGKQFKLDKNKNKRVDSEDFKLLRKSKKHKSEVDEEEMEEGNEFSGELVKAKKAGKKTFKVDGKTYPVKESIEYHIKDNQGSIIKLNEDNMVDLIENIVNEQKTKMKSMGKPVGLATYEKAHKDSGKENKEYMKSLGTKMKDYLKDGSKGKFDMNPKTFPKGNGELRKMTKKAFEMSDEL